MIKPTSPKYEIPSEKRRRFRHTRSNQFDFEGFHERTESQTSISSSISTVTTSNNKFSTIKELNGYLLQQKTSDKKKIDSKNPKNILKNILKMPHGKNNSNLYGIDDIDVQESLETEPDVLDAEINDLDRKISETLPSPIPNSGSIKLMFAKDNFSKGIA